MCNACNTPDKKEEEEENMLPVLVEFDAVCNSIFFA